MTIDERGRAAAASLPTSSSPDPAHVHGRLHRRLQRQRTMGVTGTVAGLLLDVLVAGQWLADTPEPEIVDDVVDAPLQGEERLLPSADDEQERLEEDAEAAAAAAAAAEAAARAALAGNELEVPIPVGESTPVVWTGREVVVWGGAETIAVWSPDRKAWEVRTSAPTGNTSWRLAAWTGADVLYLGGASPRQLLAWTPVLDEWEVRAELPFDVDRGEASAVWTGDELLAWDGERMVAYDTVADVWTDVPAPSLEQSGQPLLHVDRTTVPATVVAVAGTRGGQVLGPIDVAARLSDGTWRSGPSLGPVTGTVDDGDGTFEVVDGLTPRYSVLTDAGLLVVPRGGEENAAMLWPLDGDWLALDPVPRPSCEDVAAPLAVGGDAIVPGACGLAQGALFVSSDRTFVPRTLEASWPFGGQVVWTGADLIAVFGSCCDDQPGGSATVSWRQSVEVDPSGHWLRERPDGPALPGWFLPDGGDVLAPEPLRFWRSVDPSIADASVTERLRTAIQLLGRDAPDGHVSLFAGDGGVDSLLVRDVRIEGGLVTIDLDAGSRGTFGFATAGAAQADAQLRAVVRDLVPGATTLCVALDGVATDREAPFWLHDSTGCPMALDPR